MIARDVEGLEHHASPETFRAIEALSRWLGQNPAVAAKIKTGR